MTGAGPPRRSAVELREPKPRLESLLYAVARGDVQAYEQVFRQVSGAVFGLVLRVLRDRAQSEEVAQETLLQVWREAPRFQETQGSGMAWIMTIAHRRAVDRVRSEQSTAARQRRLAIRDGDVPFDCVASEIADRLEAEQVRNCLAGLSDLQREALSLAYYGGFTYRQVAEQLGVPLGTVKTRIRDGLIRLRDCLGCSLGESASPAGLTRRH